MAPPPPLPPRMPAIFGMLIIPEALYTLPEQLVELAVLLKDRIVGVVIPPLEAVLEIMRHAIQAAMWVILPEATEEHTLAAAVLFSGIVLSACGCCCLACHGCGRRVDRDEDGRARLLADGEEHSAHPAWESTDYSLCSATHNQSGGRLGGGASGQLSSEPTDQRTDRGPAAYRARALTALCPTLSPSAELPEHGELCPARTDQDGAALGGGLMPLSVGAVSSSMADRSRRSQRSQRTNCSTRFEVDEGLMSPVADDAVSLAATPRGSFASRGGNSLSARWGDTQLPSRSSCSRCWSLTGSIVEQATVDPNARRSGSPPRGSPTYRVPYGNTSEGPADASSTSRLPSERSVGKHTFKSMRTFWSTKLQSHDSNSGASPLGRVDEQRETIALEAKVERLRAQLRRAEESLVRSQGPQDTQDAPSASPRKERPPSSRLCMPSARAEARAETNSGPAKGVWSDYKVASDLTYNYNYNTETRDQATTWDAPSEVCTAASMAGPQATEASTLAKLGGGLAEKHTAQEATCVAPAEEVGATLTVAIRCSGELAA